MKLRKMKKIEMCFLALFAVLLFGSVLFATVFNMPIVAWALFLIDFPVAGITAVYASLSLREEEEEKTQVSD